MTGADLPIALASTLDAALLEAREIERLTARVPDLSLDAAYRVQEEGIRLRLARGERQVGLKMGLTSRAKMEQMNLRSPIYGVLTDAMRVPSGGVFSLKRSIHPKIEPEIAFRLARELKGPVTPEEALAACDGVFAALEILDSRYVGFKYFSLPDVVADNASSAYFVVSDRSFDPRRIDSSDLKMELRVGDTVVQSASSREIFGAPLLSLCKLSELLGERGQSVPAGSIVLTGAATQAVPLADGQKITLSVEKLGDVSVSIESG